MRKSICIALAAVLATVAGMARAATPNVVGEEKYQVPSEVAIENGVIKGTDATDANGVRGSYVVGSGQSLIGNTSTGTLTVTGGNGRNSSGTSTYGGMAAVTIGDGGSFSLAGSGSGLTLVAGDGDGASSSFGFGGNSELINEGTTTFGNGSTLSVMGGSKGGAAGKAGGVSIGNSGSMTFAAGSIIEGTLKDSTFSINNLNAGTLTIDRGITGFNLFMNAINAGRNDGFVVINGELGASNALGLAFSSSASIGRVILAPTLASPSLTLITDAVDAGKNSLLIAPVGSNKSNLPVFGEAVNAQGRNRSESSNPLYNGDYAVKVADGSFVIFRKTVTASEGDLVIGDNANVEFNPAIGAPMVTVRTVTTGDIVIGSGAVVQGMGSFSSAGEFRIGAGAQIKLTEINGTAGDMEIGDGAMLSATGDIQSGGSMTLGDAAIVETKSGDITTGYSFTAGKGARLTVGDRNDPTVYTFTATTGDITLDGSVATIYGNTKTGGTIFIQNGAKAKLLGDITTVTGIAVTDSTLTAGGRIERDVSLDNAAFSTTGAIVTVDGAVTVSNAANIRIGEGGTPGTIASLSTSGIISLSGTTNITIDKSVTTGATGDLLTAAGTLSVGGDSSSAAINAFVASQNGIGGSAIAASQYNYSGRNTITLVSHRTLDYDNPADASISRGISATVMSRLGVENAQAQVTHSFGRAIYDAGWGDDDGNSEDTGIGIIGDVFKAENTPAFTIASTTWSILRAFGNAGGSIFRFSSAAEANAAASALTGQNQAASVNAVMGMAGGVANGVNSRVAANNVARFKANELAGGSGDALAAAILNSDFANRFWLGGLGMWENAGASDGSSGYDLDTWGLQTGYDRVFGPVTVGGSFAYSRGDFEEKDVLDNNSKIHNYAFNLYGTYNHASGFFATLMGGYAYSDVALRRAVIVNNFESADYHVNTWTVGGNLGYDWRPLDNLTVTPRVGLYYHHARSSAITSNYTSIADLRNHTAQLPIDLAATYSVPMTTGRLDLTVRGGYAYNFSDSGAEGMLSYNNLVGVSPVNIEGRGLGRNIWNVGGGVKYRAGRFDVGVNYDFTSKSSYHAHRVSGSVGVSF